MRASEIQPNKLVIFDIDDTLVHTQTKVHVIKDGQVVNSLNSHDFTHYKLRPGEEFDFGDFRDAREFFANAKPIIPMLKQLKQDIATGNKVVMVTARADFNDKELFLDTFRKYGVDMSKVHVYRAGNMTGKIQTEEKKKIIIRELLNKGRYTKAIMYDDAVPNLDSFLSLHEEYPHTKFYAWHVSLEGEASEYSRTDEDISRRGFLRGLGGAALAGAAGSALAKSSPTAVQTVGPGDTVYSIARQTGVSPLELYKLNGMDNNTKLVPGQKIKVPQVAKPTAPPQEIDDLDAFIDKKMSDKEREDLVSLFTQDAEKNDKPGVDTRMTGPGSDAKKHALPDKNIKPKNQEKHAGKKPAKELPQSGDSVPWKDIRDYLSPKMDTSHWAGMMANMWHESSFIPSNYNPNDRGGPSGGLCQWHDNRALGYHRFSDMVKAVPNWKTNWRGQLDFALKEPEGRRYLGTRFTNPISASIAWTKTFERPADADAVAKKRSQSPQMRQYASNP
jgi:murein DD-endopeptidase MepM/ murein hydrolase activator NlpD/FMN phosphatase YigB (HAD superfamily)